MSWDWFAWDQILEQIIEERQEATQTEETQAALSAEVATIVEELQAEFHKMCTTLHDLPILCPENLKADAGKTMLYEITAGLIDRKEFSPILIIIIHTLCQRCDVPCTEAALASSYRSKLPLFQEVGILSDKTCGDFWQALISRLPASPDSTGEGHPPELVELLALAERFYTDFAGDRAKSLKLDGCFAIHQQRFSLLTPDVDQLKKAIRNQDFSDYPYTNPYRDLLTASFPVLSKWYSLEELAGMDEEAILVAAYRHDAPVAVQMWQLLLDTVGEHLHDPAVAERLLTVEPAGHFSRIEAWHCDDRLDPILDALDCNDRFARQFYQSAALRGYPITLLVVCCARGRISLMERLRELLRQSPFLTNFYPAELPKWIRLLPEHN